MFAEKLIQVEVPDCVASPQPWWESSGMTIAVWFIAVLIIVAIATLIGMCIDNWSKP